MTACLKDNSYACNMERHDYMLKLPLYCMELAAVVTAVAECPGCSAVVLEDSPDFSGPGDRSAGPAEMSA